MSNPTQKKKEDTKMKRGRKSVREQLEAKIGQKKVFQMVAEKVGDVSSILEFQSKLKEQFEVSVNTISLRNYLRREAKNGNCRAGTPLHSLTKIPRGRPKKNVTEAAVVTVEQPATEQPEEEQLVEATV